MNGVSRMIHITLNGQKQTLPADTTIAQLLQRQSLEPRGVAVEVNLDIAPREQHETWRLADGDQVEIVTFVGGG